MWLTNGQENVAFKITRNGQLSVRISASVWASSSIVDLSLAQHWQLSTTRKLEEMGLETVGTHGTTAALAPALNDQVKKAVSWPRSGWCFHSCVEDEGTLQRGSLTQKRKL